MLPKTAGHDIKQLSKQTGSIYLWGIETMLKFFLLLVLLTLNSFILTENSSLDGTNKRGHSFGRLNLNSVFQIAS